jgi:hypothetical protein
MVVVDSLVAAPLLAAEADSAVVSVVASTVEEASMAAVVSMAVDIVNSD